LPGSGAAKRCLHMNETRLRYFEQEDVLHLTIFDEPESRSVELSPNITVELNDKNEVIGVEILKASAFLRDTVLGSVQARTLQPRKADS
jgi:uncharacterized protein YuzE